MTVCVCVYACVRMPLQMCECTCMCVCVSGRPELVPTVTGRAGLCAVGAYQSSDLLQGTQLAGDTPLAGHSGARPGEPGEAPQGPVQRSSRSFLSGAARAVTSGSAAVRGLEAELELNLLMFVERPDAVGGDTHITDTHRALLTHMWHLESRHSPCVTRVTTLTHTHVCMGA